MMVLHFGQLTLTFCVCILVGDLTAVVSFFPPPAKKASPPINSRGIPNIAPILVMHNNNPTRAEHNPNIFLKDAGNLVKTKGAKKMIAINTSSDQPMNIC